MPQERREGPNLIVSQGALPRGHAGPTDAVLYFPKGEPFRVVLDAVCRQLRRLRVEAFGHRRRRRATLRRAAEIRVIGGPKMLCNPARVLSVKNSRLSLALNADRRGG